MTVSKFPVTKQPYDATLEENMSMYDKLPYKRNIDMCNASTLALESGNLVKYYRCSQAEEPVEIHNQDEHFSNIVQAHIKAHERNIMMLHEKFPTIYGVLEEVSPEDTSLIEGDASSKDD